MAQALLQEADRLGWAQVMRDADHGLARDLKIESSTEVFVLDRNLKLVYRGAVDDRYGFGYSLEQPRQRLLVDALDAVLAGKQPPIAATHAPGCAVELRAGAASAARLAPTYYGDVAAIVQNHCLECHRTGGLAPFSLEKYDDVVEHAAMIGRVVDRGVMPPWFAAPGAGPWIGDRSLNEQDKQTLAAWLKSGREKGDAAQAPPPRHFPDDWMIGKPDLIVELPKEVAVKADGQMPYVNLSVKTGFPEDRWIKAVQLRPTAPDVVHHVLVHAVAPFNRDDDRPVRERVRERVQDRDGFLAAYVPGNDHVIYADGLAKRLPAGATLHFQLHYTPNGTAASDRTRLGIVFAKEQPKHEVRTHGISNRRLSIPPGAADHAERAQIPVPKDAHLLGFMPHMHLRGKSFRYELVAPGGKRTVLLDVPHYDFNWQLAYRLVEPLAVSRGSRVEVVGWFDNSAGNPANPDPSRLVKWGDQSDEEMLIGYLEYYYD